MPWYKWKICHWSPGCSLVWISRVVYFPVLDTRVCIIKSKHGLGTICINFTCSLLSEMFGNPTKMLKQTVPEELQIFRLFCSHAIEVLLDRIWTGKTNLRQWTTAAKVYAVEVLCLIDYIWLINTINVVHFSFVIVSWFTKFLFLFSLFCNRCRIASLLKWRTIPVSVLFSKAPFTSETVAAAVSDGSSPIDVVIWIRNKDEDNHRPGAIEGYCDNIHKGNIRVGINIGNCPGYGNSNGHTGWISVSRLIIEEVPRSQ